MLKSLYKNLIGKLNLNKDQLLELKSRLNASNICFHHFVIGENMCPNTTALAIKLKVNSFSSDNEVRNILRQKGITKTDLAKFYLLYDIPTMFSSRMHEKLIKRLREGVSELLVDK